MSSIEPLFEQARAALRNNEPERARDLCAEARALDPNDFRLILVHGFALRRCNDFAAAEPLLRKVIEADPGLESAHHELGLALRGMGRLSVARQALERAVGLKPDYAAAWRDLYEVCAAEGDDAAAAEAYRQMIRQKGLDPLLQKALDLVGSGRLGAAEGICREYLKRRPHDVDAIRLLAEIGINLGVLDESINLLERCLELAPDFHIARANFVTALARHQEFAKALEACAHLRSKEPDKLTHKVQYASVLAMAGRFQDAHEQYAEVLKEVPDNAGILTSYGHALRYGGKGDEAADAYRRAIAVESGAGEAYWSLANLKTVEFDDALLEIMENEYAALDRPGPNKYHLAFALGKAHEDRGDYDASFRAYDDGNAIKRQFSAYKPEGTRERVDAMIEHCGSSLLECPGHPSNAPIFILGLPRAGSTLLEQILASHSQVEATAELPFIGRIASDISGVRKRSEESLYPSSLNELSADERTAMGQRYLDRAAAYRTDKPYFVDKLPNNWVHIGLIKAILPNATIIDARRHPMAACFANFKQLFARGQEFTYGLEEIGHYYADYLRLMDHWHGAFPGGLLTVQYEEVVKDLDSQVAGLLAHCGLPFEEACLRYYEKDRAIRTASSEQVRQPIYSSAVNVWEHYRHHLEPLETLLKAEGVAL